MSDVCMQLHLRGDEDSRHHVYASRLAIVLSLAATATAWTMVLGNLLGPEPFGGRGGVVERFAFNLMIYGLCTSAPVLLIWRAAQRMEVAGDRVILLRGWGPFQTRHEYPLATVRFGGKRNVAAHFPDGRKAVFEWPLHRNVSLLRARLAAEPAAEPDSAG
jgi:hypothetical protein